MRIGIDIMGGDYAPQKTVHGAILALDELPQNITVVLFGKENEIISELKQHDFSANKFEIIDCPEVISMEEHATKAFRTKPNSSISKGFEYLAKGEIDGFASAGNTGAMLVISRLLLNTIPGISKPALAGLWPNKNNMNVVLDLGANIECNEKNLCDFSSMGAALFKSLFLNEKPRVALLNVGLEENKGNEILKKAFSIMKKSNIKNFDFVGYIEGNHIMDGNVDVVITDGFTGNVALKTAEGTANFITNNLKKSLNKLSILFSYASLKKFKSKLDPRKYNGAIFLGLESPLVKSHGSTDSVGFANSIKVCGQVIKANLIEKIKSNLITIDDKF